MSVTLTDKQAGAIFSRLRIEWYSDACTAALDDAMRSIDEQLTKVGK